MKQAPQLYLYRLIIMLALAIPGSYVSAQAPPNDHCSQASEIVIPQDGFALGTIQSDMVNLANSTRQAGESFQSTLVDNGLNRKTVWYKFTIPTARNVTIELKQKDTLIAQNAVGFEVYKAGNCLPNLGEITPYLSPVPKFGNSANTCLPPGTYLIQVCANFKANAEVWLNLVLKSPMPVAYDNKINAFSFGQVTKNQTLNLSAGCLSIESKDEICLTLGQEYTQTAWFTFRTATYPDLFGIVASANYAVKPGSDYLIGYNLYEGNVSTDPMSINPFDTSVISTSKTSGNTTYLSLAKTYACQTLKANTAYSIQLFFHKDFALSFQISVFGGVNSQSKSQDPLHLPPKFKFGMIPHSQTLSVTDTIACNASVGKYICGNVIPGSLIIDSTLNPQKLIDTFDLNLWITFEVTENGVMNFDNYVPDCQNSSNKFYPALNRLFTGDVSQSCNLTLCKRWTYKQQLCLTAGKYSLQVLFKSKPAADITCYNSVIGRPFVFSFSYWKYIDQLTAHFDRYQFADDLGDIVKASGKSKTGQPDYYGSQPDTVVIDSQKIHGHLTYRQFYLSEPSQIDISPRGNPNWKSNAFFRGKATEGTDQLKLVKTKSKSENPFSVSYNTNDCIFLDTGWYTVITSAELQCVDNTELYSNNIKVSVTNLCTPKYDRPFKAFLVNNGQPLVYGQSDPTKWVKAYPTPQGCYSCATDSFLLPTVNECQYEKAVYYVFTLGQESALNTNIDNQRFRLYDRDIRIDSLSFYDSTHILKPCNKGKRFCLLQPGTYTLAIYGTSAYAGAPTIYVDKVQYSNYDHAINTYDMGLIPGNKAIKASPPDYISCTTGSHKSDPVSFSGGLENTIYPTPQNQVYSASTKKNLWYTFTASGTGNIAVSADIITTGLTGKTLPFAVFRSDVNGSLPWNQVLANKEIDSTINQGLALLVKSPDFNTKSLQFSKQGCDTVRYYVVLNSSWSSSSIYENYQVVVSVSYDGVVNGRNGDFCENAITTVANGPGNFSGTALVNCHTIGEGYGEDGSNMGCLFDQKNYKSTWFRFSLNVTQKVDLSFSLANNTNASPAQVRYRLLSGSCDALTPGSCVENSLSSFKLDCMASGDYYLQVVTPNSATGTLSATIIVTPSAYPICKPSPLFNPLANFVTTGSCNRTVFEFKNLSTSGPAIKYLWNFGNGSISNIKAPTFSFLPSKAIDTMTVKLIVNDTLHLTSDSIELPVIVFRDSISLSAGEDKAMLNTNLVGVQLHAVTNYPNPILEWNPKNTLNNAFIADPIAKPASTTRYQVNLLGDNCTLSDSLTVFVNSGFNLGNKDLCKGDTVTIIGPGGYDTYLWSTSETSKDIRVWNEGVYTLGAKIGNLVFTDSSIVSWRDKPIIELGKDTGFCKGNAIILNAGLGFISYNWSTKDQAAQIVVSSKGGYSVRVTNSYCASLDSIQVDEFDPPTISLPDTGFCEKGFVILDAGGPFSSYKWSTGTQTQTIKVSTSSFYSVTVSDSHCASTDSMFVQEYLTHPELPNDTGICTNSQLILDAGPGFASYLWSTGSLQQSIKVDSPGKYKVNISNHGCKGEAEVNVLVYPVIPIFDLKDTSFCGDFNLMLDAGEGFNYLWSPAGQHSRTLMASSFGTYTVLRTDINHCSTTDTFLIVNYCEGDLFVPNAFTVNGDGINDFFTGYGKDIRDFDLKVFSRWGELLFETRDMKTGWDGKFSGEPVMSDVYVWQITYRIGTDKLRLKKGTVTLIK